MYISIHNFTGLILNYYIAICFSSLKWEIQKQRQNVSTKVDTKDTEVDTEDTKFGHMWIQVFKDKSYFELISNTILKLAVTFRGLYCPQIILFYQLIKRHQKDTMWPITDMFEVTLFGTMFVIYVSHAILFYHTDNNYFKQRNKNGPPQALAMNDFLLEEVHLWNALPLPF